MCRSASHIAPHVGQGAESAIERLNCAQIAVMAILIAAWTAAYAVAQSTSPTTKGYGIWKFLVRYQVPNTRI
jgi:hypothetical protein